MCPRPLAGRKEGGRESCGREPHEFTLVREKDKTSHKCVLNHRLDTVCEGRL